MKKLILHQLLSKNFLRQLRFHFNDCKAHGIRPPAPTRWSKRNAEAWILLSIDAPVSSDPVILPNRAAGSNQSKLFLFFNATRKPYVFTCLLTRIHMPGYWCSKRVERHVGAICMRGVYVCFVDWAELFLVHVWTLGSWEATYWAGIYRSNAACLQAIIRFGKIEYNIKVFVWTIF